MVGRFGGDEFVIAVTQSNREIVEQIVQRILNGVRKPLMIDGNQIKTTVSIGIACYPESGKGIDELIAAADRAMYVAKKSGKNNYVFVGDIEPSPYAANNNRAKHSIQMSNTVS